MQVKFECVFDIDESVDNAFESIKDLEHHVEFLMSLEEWPEILSVSNVTVSKIDEVK